MEQLFQIDLQDYEGTNRVYRRPSARGIIFGDNGRIALVYSEKEKYYKFPGGGIHDDEDKVKALIREVKEETGLIVIPRSVQEFGSVLRRQRSNKSFDTLFEQENFYYFCEVMKETSSQNLDDYEKEAGFVLKFVDLSEAIDANSRYKSEDFFDEIMIKRELRVLQLIDEHKMNIAAASHDKFNVAKYHKEIG